MKQIRRFAEPPYAENWLSAWPESPETHTEYPLPCDSPKFQTRQRLKAELYHKSHSIKFGFGKPVKLFGVGKMMSAGRKSDL